jgi:hypothetical protein
MDDLMLEVALGYAQRGWSLVPMKMDEKKPAVRWKVFQEKRAGSGLLRKWFRTSSTYGVGVVFGAVSGNLASRDFDDMVAYNRWAEANPVLARDLPTVETRRGRHVYFAVEPERMAGLRRRIGKPDGTGAIDCGDGELRAGIGCYSVLPPSRHPSGHVYRWLVPLADELPIVDVEAVGLFSCFCHATESTEDDRDYGDNRGLLKTTEAINGVGGDSLASDNIERAIRDSLPCGPGQRYRLVFELCRALKGIPAMADADPTDLRPYVQQWHKLALPVITTEPFEETWIDFLKGWGRVKFPKGAEPMTKIFELALSSEVPDKAKEWTPRLQLLVALCRELQRASGDGPFYLSCRTAGKLIDADFATASRYLFLLQMERVLNCTAKGKKGGGKASRFRYLYPL